MSSSLKKDVSASPKDEDMLDVIIRLGKWRGVGIGLFYFIISLVIFSYGIYSLVRYRETKGTVVESKANPKALQTPFGANINSYVTSIKFPITEHDEYHTSDVTTNLQYTPGTELIVIYDTQTLHVQISNNTYSWVALVLGIIGMIGSGIYILLSLRSRTFQTTVGLYGKLL